MFFSFDGVDGAGKSTQMAQFCTWLEDQGYDVVACRDPGGTPLGERIREILLSPAADGNIHRRSEMFLYMAARAQLVEEVIRPALEARKIVVSDRYVLANLVYQGYAGGLDVNDVRLVGEVCTAGIQPDCVFVLDISVPEAKKRLTRDLDRMESQGEAFQERLREGFLREAATSCANTHVIDAARPVHAVQEAIQTIARPVLAR
jgi:dTMP kinase